MNALLDTCTLIWMCADPARLSLPAKRVMTEAMTLYLSDASIMEISLKWQAGKLKLPSPPRFWIEEQTKIQGLARLPMEPEDFYRSSELSAIHRDPFDRLLVVQAQRNQLALITPDPWIHRYPVHCAW